MRRLVLLFGVLFAVLARGLAAQGGITVGERVRLHCSGVTYGDASQVPRDFRFGARMQGTVVAVSPDTLTLDVKGEGAPQVIPLSIVSEVEVQRGRSTLSQTGGAIGAFVGAISGGLVGAASKPPPQGSIGPDLSGLNVAGGILLGGLLGGGVGALIGSRIHADRWVHVPLERARLSLATLRRGAGLALSLTF